MKYLLFIYYIISRFIYQYIKYAEFFLLVPFNKKLCLIQLHNFAHTNFFYYLPLTLRSLNGCTFLVFSVILIPDFIPKFTCSLHPTRFVSYFSFCNIPSIQKMQITTPFSPHSYELQIMVFSLNFYNNANLKLYVTSLYAILHFKI